MAVRIERVRYLPKILQPSTIYLANDWWWRGYTETIVENFKAAEDPVPLYKPATAEELTDAMDAETAEEFASTIGVVSTSADNVFTEPVEFQAAVYENALTVTDNIIRPMLASVFTVQQSGSFPLVISLPVSKPSAIDFILILRKNQTATIAFWDGINWGGFDTSKLTAVGTDVISFSTMDGGVTWMAEVLGQNMS